MHETARNDRVQVQSWQRLPAKAAACAGLIAFATCVVFGLAAGNTAMTILGRAILAMAACWSIAWVAGMLVLHAVRGDVLDHAADGDLGTQIDGAQVPPEESETLESAAA